VTLTWQPSTHSMIFMVRPTKRPPAFAGSSVRIVRSAKSLDESLAHASKQTVWVSYESDLTKELVKRLASIPANIGSGLFIHPLDIKTIPVLSSRFQHVAFNVDGTFLPAEELAEVLGAEQRANRFLGGFVNQESQTVTFWRGNLESLTVPCSNFEPSGDGTTPDFADFSITDGGQTVKFGDYEAAVEAILYESDPKYRRAIAKRRSREDRSFGAALRRLRKQRGLRREDFAPAVAAKTVARIEQGLVTHPQKATLAALAKRLGVEPNEIASF
jgi:hypothetical protein